MLTSSQKKWRLFRAWTSRNPLWCAWQVTYRCNFRCRFCHYWRDPMGRQPEPGVEQYALGARKLAQFGTLMVSLAGGEPLLRLDLPDLVREIGRYHFPFITTNGWLATRQLADELMSSGLWGVSISIDYDNPAQHDAARGMDGAWDQAWRAVEIFSRARRFDFQRVNVISVLMRDNARQIERVCEMAARRGAYFMVQPYGHLKTGSRSLGHDDGPVAPRLLKMRREFPNFLSNPYYLERFDRFLAEGIPSCRAGRAFFNIDSAGDVAICVEAKARPIANLFDDDPRIIRRRLREASRGNRCQECWYNCRGEIESLYSPVGLIKSLPTLLLDRGAASGPDAREKCMNTVRT